MGRLATATLAFFRSLFDAAIAEQIDRVLSGNRDLTSPEPPPITPASAPAMTAPQSVKPARSEALTLLATLQREARFVDFFQEKLDGYSDAQIGAAVRDVHRDTAIVLQRLFSLRPVAQAAEGSELALPQDLDAGKYRLTGNVTDQSTGKGILMHPGWEASRCEMPIWNGTDSAAKVIAPAEIEVR